ncbi:hypothetical protein [Tenacibaculum finnmarkense]|uniref:hypothetical protein n=1 Tax=Tenacibaculum finnmarkense TaxID=2781243 RepID=UPI003BB517FB
MTYNVLWIDDEYKTRGTSFITLAEQDDIIIEAVESHEEGMVKLKEKDGFYDAVILDAKVKLNKADTTTNLKGLSASRDFLIAYNKDKILPYFIYTGQPDYQKNDVFEDSYGKYYIKGTDNEQLLEDIKKEADNRPQTIVKKEFPEAFICFEKIIDKKHEHLLFDILINYIKGDYRKKNINVQRELLEEILKSLNNPIPYLKDVLFNDKYKNPILEHCIKYIEGEEGEEVLVDKKNKIKIKADKTIDKTIQSSFRILKESTSEFSHAGDGKVIILNENEIVKYEFLNNTFLLLKILVWLPEFTEKHYKNWI